MAPMADESTPLFRSELVPKSGSNTTFTDASTKAAAGTTSLPNANPSNDRRVALFLFLEAKTPAGLKYESFTIFLIFLSVVTFILSSLYLPEYNTESPIATQCGSWCDAIWFGNYPDNALAGLGIGATSIVEIFVVAVFSIDYILRYSTADLIDPKFKGVVGRLCFITTFFSLVDLASTVPFYVDSFLLPGTDLAASTFLRMFRLLRMMKVEGRFDLALGMIDDVFRAQKGVLGTALFVGITVWGVLSSFFYLAERKNPDMIYCGAAPDWCFEDQDDVDTSLCTTDEWGVVDCSAAGCESKDGQEVCWNLYRSIVNSSFWTLTNLFGEFPLFDQHSAWGQVLGTFTAVFACAVFALPVGILASGLEDQIASRRDSEQQKKALDNENNKGGEEQEDEEDEIVGDETTFRGRVYNIVHRQHSPHARALKSLINVLIVGCAISFIFDSVSDDKGGWHTFFSWFQFFSFAVFAGEYFLRMYSAGENPKHRGRGLFSHAMSFSGIVDVLTIFPYWVGIASVSGPAPTLFLLFKIFHIEKCNKAFSTFGNVLRENFDVLTVTGFSAVLLWIFFASLLYYTERDNPDEDMKGYYSTIPNSMWVTLLNLSGECPLAHYSNVGKVIVGIIGLFATAVFGIPIGILGAGFEELVTSKYEDSPDEEDTNTDPSALNRTGFSHFQRACYRFVNGIGSKSATMFELLIYVLIAATVVIGVVETVPGYENFGNGVEWVAVIIFTIEYLLRLIGCGADPEFSTSSGFMTRVKYIFSFYSIIDLLAIVPFYLAYAMPNSWIDAHDEYFRMMRLFRLLKLDKYVPSISLVDDVFRLKRRVLLVAGYAAGTLWFLYSAALYISERNDDAIEVDPLPLYACVGPCYMSDRYSNFFKSIPLTGIHLTGDFPLIEYGGLGRVILFFVVIAAVGVVSIPSGVIASGFAEIVQSKTKGINMHVGENKGDDWYDIAYQRLKGKPPPSSILGPRVDALQVKAKEYLDGKVDERTGKVSRTQFSTLGRLFFFALILSNILAVILESIPEIDKNVGNAAGNFFDVFESWSVFFFTIDYLLRLFSARKSREALYSPWVYSITFFGIVDIVSILPWYLQVVLARTGHLNGDEAKIFRIFRIFRVLQLEDFIIAFSKLDNVFRASKDVLKATGLMAIIIWVGSSALFFIFEQNNPNFRQCDGSIPLVGTEEKPGCYDFDSTSACNDFYPDMCIQAVFKNMPNTLYMVAVFLGGEWGVVDFTWQGKFVCMFLCIAGIALYSIPVGTLFDSFGSLVGLGEEEDEEDEEEDHKQSPLVEYN